MKISSGDLLITNATIIIGLLVLLTFSSVSSPFVQEERSAFFADWYDLQEIANLLLKRDKIEIAGLGNMNTFCLNTSKFTFPYSENIVVIEVASEKSHQSVKKYCDQTRRDINRKGMTMTNLMSLSILEKLK